MKRKVVSILFAIVALIALALPLVAVGAQDSQVERSLTLTEEQINNSFAVANPRTRRVSDVRVDLQPGQVTLSFNWTSRRPRGEGTTTVAVSSVWTPTIENGRLFWTLQSATVNGQPASDELLRQINAHIAAAWHNYIRRNIGAGAVTNVTITDNDITITWTPRVI